MEINLVKLVPYFVQINVITMLMTVLIRQVVCARRIAICRGL